MPQNSLAEKGEWSLLAEELNFRLEGVLRGSDEEYGDFEGPLNLILQLISKNKIEIRDIKIAEITDQYIEYLECMKKLDLEVASEFVRMAAHLLYIKTKTLLARDEEQVSELEELMSSLESLKRKELYLRLKAACELLRPLETANLGMFTKPRELLPREGYNYSHTPEELIYALGAVFERPGGEIPPVIVRIPSRINYPTERKAEQLIELMRRRRQLRLVEVFRDNGSRSELVATFLAVLELCRSGKLLITGAGEECVMSYYGSAEAEE